MISLFYIYKKFYSFQEDAWYALLDYAAVYDKGRKFDVYKINHIPRNGSRMTDHGRNSTMTAQYRILSSAHPNVLQQNQLKAAESVTEGLKARNQIPKRKNR